MGKRTNHEKIERDFYPTPYEAVIPLLPHLYPNTRFCEPCAGDGRLIDHLIKHNHICARAIIQSGMNVVVHKEGQILFQGADDLGNWDESHKATSRITEGKLRWYSDKVINVMGYFRGSLYYMTVVDNKGTYERVVE